MDTKIEPSKGQASKFDKIGIWLSAVCIIHCTLPTILVLLLLSFGLFESVSHDITEHSVYFHLLLIVPISAVALYSFQRGYRNHKSYIPSIFAIVGVIFLSSAMGFHEWETLLTIVGSLLLIPAHLINSRLYHHHAVSN